MSILVVYNATGRKNPDNSNFYIKNIKTILEQDYVDMKLVFSGDHIPPNTFKKLYDEFGSDISYCLTNDKLAVNQTFNHTVLKSVEVFGEFDGYMYVASDVSFSNDKNSLTRLATRTDNPLNGIISPEIDKDNGYYWWFNFDESQNLWDVFSRDEDFVVPLGATANLHCKIFSKKIFNEYGRPLPDIFVSYCTESIFSFLAAAVGQRFVITNDVLCHHGNETAVHAGLDGHTLAFGAGWDILYDNAPRSIAEIINDPEAYACGLGYEEWAPPFIAKGKCVPTKPHLMHDPEQFDKQGFSKDNRLRDYIKENFFLPPDVLDYNKIKFKFFKGK